MERNVLLLGRNVLERDPTGNAPLMINIWPSLTLKTLYILHTQQYDYKGCIDIFGQWKNRWPMEKIQTPLL